MATTGPNSCDPCCNIPANVNDAYFKQAVLVKLCDISAQDDDWEILCDPTDGQVVFVKFTYDSSGAVTGSTAVLPDGTAYAGDISALVACDQATLIDSVVYNEDDVHSAGSAGAYVLSVRKDVAASSAGASDDFAGFITDSTGRLWTTSTVLNAAGAAAVNIQDGGNSITVDGAVTTTTTLAEVVGKYAAVAFGSVGAAYATLLANATALRYLKVQNGTDAAVIISLDAGVTDFMRLGPGEKEVVDLAAAGGKVSTDISQKYETGAPTTGSLYASAFS